MDVHRARFLPYEGSPINALAFSADHKEPLGPLDNLRLAVGRANGDLEIWNPMSGGWVQEKLFHSGSGRSVEGLAWTMQPVMKDGKRIKNKEEAQLRLFSIGYSSSVTEWDIASGKPKRHSADAGSEVWCMAAQPPPSRQEIQAAGDSADELLSQAIAVGYADGSVALLSTANNDLQFLRFVHRELAEPKPRALCIAFKSRDQVVVGFSNGTVGIYDINKSTNIRTIRVTTIASITKAARRRDVNIWAVCVVPRGGPLVVADSLGVVHFYDRHNYSRIQMLATHKADILSIVASPDGERIFTGSSDRSIGIFGKSGNTWVRVRRVYRHDNDVKALAAYDHAAGDSNISFLVSGGNDVALAVTPLKRLEDELHRKICGLPATPFMSYSDNGQYVATWSGTIVRLYGLREEQDESLPRAPHELCAKIKLAGEEFVNDASITRDGQYLVVTSVSETRIFKLSPIAFTDTMKVQKISTAQKIPGASKLRISPDQKWLALVRDAIDINLYRLDLPGNQVISHSPICLQLTEPNTTDLSSYRLSSYIRSITELEFSPDGKLLVAANMRGLLRCWKLEGEEDRSALGFSSPIRFRSKDEESDLDDSDDDEDEDLVIFGQRWILNRPPEQPGGYIRLADSAHLLTFRPSRTEDPSMASYKLFVLTRDHSIFEFNPLTGTLTQWSKRNPITELDYAGTFLRIMDRAKGCFWHSTSEFQRLYIWGASFIYMYDVSQNFTAGHADLNSGDAITTKYKPEDPARKRKYGTISGAGGQKNTGVKGFVTRLAEREQAGKELEIKGIEQAWAEEEQERKKQKRAAKTKTRRGNPKPDATEPVPTSKNDEDDGDEDTDDEEDIPNDRITLIQRPEPPTPMALDDHGTPMKEKTSTTTTTSTHPSTNPQSDEDDDDTLTNTNTHSKHRKVWFTHQYRDILGIIPMAAHEDRIELVVVERPVWEMKHLPAPVQDVDSQNRETQLEGW